MSRSRYYTARVVGAAALLAVTLFLFRGNYNDGMNFDEVFRLNNLIPLVNPTAAPYEQSIYSIRLFGWRVPVMYKEYVSSALVLPYFPIAFFHDYRYGLRLLETVYFSLSVLTFFWIGSRYDLLLAWLAAFLAGTAPLFYPEARHGFANAFHLLFLSVSATLLVRYFHGTPKLRYLFGGLFIAAFSVNLMMYTVWLLAAFAVTTLLFFPSTWAFVARSGWRMLVAVGALLLGGLNHVLYNATHGFPAVQRVYLHVFEPQTFNQNPIDYKPVKSLATGLTERAQLFLSFLGGMDAWYLLLTAVTAFAYLLFLWRLVRTRQLSSGKVFFLFPLTLLLTGALIGISPNTTRAGHYVYLLPLWGLSIVGLLPLARIAFPQMRAVRWGAWGVVIGAAVLNVYTSSSEVDQFLQTGGTGHFSPAIFDLQAYIQQKHVPSSNIVHLEWGMYSQLYFLNRGRYTINQHAFELLGAKAQTERYEIYRKVFLTSYSQGPELYFPLYGGPGSGPLRTDRPGDFQESILAAAADETRDSLLRFVESKGGHLEPVKEFFERDGEPAFTLYALQDAEGFTRRLRTEFVVSDALQIQGAGANVTQISPHQNFGLWVKCRGHSPHSVIVVNGSALTTFYRSDHVTAAVPAELILASHAGRYFTVELYDLERNLRTPPVTVIAPAAHG
jgi:hypothetical protein